MEIEITSEGSNISKVSVERTARVLMDGLAYIPTETLC